MLSPALLLSILACWRPTPVEIPEARVRPAEEVFEQAEQAEQEQAEVEALALNPDPDGLDPYLVVTATVPVTIVDDAGKPLAILNSKAVKLEVRAEDGDVRRKVFCSSCAPPTEGWVRTEEITVVKVDG